jgi:hypothetical protein
LRPLCLCGEFRFGVWSSEFGVRLALRVASHGPHHHPDANQNPFQTLCSLCLCGECPVRSSGFGVRSLVSARRCGRRHTNLTTTLTPKEPRNCGLPISNCGFVLVPRLKLLLQIQSAIRNPKSEIASAAPRLPSWAFIVRYRVAEIPIPARALPRR